MDASTQIHVSRDGQNFGPYSLAQARQYVQSGQILPTDWAWYEGAQDWAPVSHIPELAAIVPIPPPMPIPIRPQPASERAFESRKDVLRLTLRVVTRRPFPAKSTHPLDL